MGLGLSGPHHERLGGGSLADIDPQTAYYFVSLPHPQLSRTSSMARWCQRLFLLLHELTTDRVAQLRVPRTRIITVGRELDI